MAIPASPNVALAATLGGTVGGMFHDAALAHADGVALRSGDTCLSYCRLDAQVNQLAHALLAQGVGHGARVAILSENSIAFVTLMLACARIGAIAACLNWRSTEEDVHHCLGLTTPHLLLVSRQFAHLVPKAWHGSSRMDVDRDVQDLMLSQPTHAPDIPVGSEDGILILFTSGTTGRPKAALISHRAMIARGLLMRADWDMRRTDGFIAWSPLSHMAAADPTLACLMQGSTVTVLPGFDPDAIVTALTQHPVGWLVLLPGMIERLADALERPHAPLQRVAAAGCMANLVPREQIARISRLLNAPFLNSLGSTETGIAPASGNSFAPGQVPQSLAKLQNTGCEIRLVDERDHEVPTGVVGEICLRAPTLFSGYWNDPEATAAAFAGGWYHMGDAFYRDAQGQLHFADRQKYLIKSGGENIYPAEIEWVLRGVDGVLDAVVVRRPDPVWGEVPVAFIVIAPGRAPDKTALQRALDQHVARFKHPKAMVFVPETEIERNITGKIRRDVLERRAQSYSEPGETP